MCPSVMCPSVMCLCMAAWLAVSPAMAQDVAPAPTPRVDEEGVGAPDAPPPAAEPADSEPAAPAEEEAAVAREAPVDAADALSLTAGSGAAEPGALDEDIDAEPWGPPPPPPPPEDDEDEAPSPFTFQTHGYYRARLVTIDSQPVDSTGARDGVDHAAYGFMRLRLNPELAFGYDPASISVRLKAQIDALDNVVFGDNARLSPTPIFAADPSRTDIFGQDLDAYFKLRRIWLEFGIPIGQVRIGRQPSHGGLGLLFNDGNGFRNDFGDALIGSTFDRILFFTRPLTIANAITGGSSEETPLIVGIAYDWLAEDTLGVGIQPDPAGRSAVPYAFLSGGEDDVWQTVAVLAWKDLEWNDEVSPNDELTAGLVLIHRGQDSTSTDIWIGNFFYRLLWSAFGPNGPQLYTEGEIYTIQGRSHAVALASPTLTLDPTTGRTGPELGANIWSGVMRAGVEDQLYSARLEAGFSTGQPSRGVPVGIDELTQRPVNPAYQVGLLLYPVVLAARTANAYPSELTSRGGIWNSIYVLPQARFRPIPGVEFIGQFLVAFADQLNGPLANDRPIPNEPGRFNSACGLDFDDCLLAWELDLALKLDWNNDAMRWSNEFGLMNAGPALGPLLSNSLLWTLQSRVAFVF